MHQTVLNLTSPALIYSGNLSRRLDSFTGFELIYTYNYSSFLHVVKAEMKHYCPKSKQIQ